MHATVRSVIELAGNTAEDVCVLDTEASPEHLSRGTAQFADTMLIVVEPYYKSLETGRRMALLGRDLGLPRVALLANKIRDERERAAVEQFASQHELEIAGMVPFDESFPESERARQAPLDFAPDSAAVAAIAALGRQLATTKVDGNGRA
jgi:CO dehydrogenase maturation factor